MALGFLNSKEKEENDELMDGNFVELDADMSEEMPEVVIRAETLSEFKDVEKVQQHLREDRIVWVNIKPLKNKDMTDLKRAVKRLKKTIKAIDGDMAGVDEDWIVTCPDYATIERTSDKIDDESG